MALQKQVKSDASFAPKLASRAERNHAAPGARAKQGRGWLSLLLLVSASRFIASSPMRRAGRPHPLAMRKLVQLKRIEPGVPPRRHSLLP